MTTLYNPVLNGFHPDPSVVRVGDEWFLATSTFEYLPGNPDPPLARLRELGAHRARRCEPRDVRNRRRPDRGRRLGADDPAPRRRLPPGDHGGDGPRDAALHRDGCRRALERRRRDRRHRRHREHQRHRPRYRVGCRRQCLRHVLGTDPERAGDRHAPGHPAGQGRSRESHRPGGAALALVGHRRPVPRGPASLRGRTAPGT